MSCKDQAVGIQKGYLLRMFWNTVHDHSQPIQGKKRDGHGKHHKKYVEEK